ncbi:hypothetical protein RCL1_001950 [Eukaryota sp. TZLM3-RCL]
MITFNGILILFIIPCCLSASVSVSRPLVLGSPHPDFSISSYSHIASLPFNHVLLFHTDNVNPSRFYIIEVLATTPSVLSTIIHYPQCPSFENLFNLNLSDFPSNKVAFAHLHADFSSPSPSSDLLLAAHDFYADVETNIVSSLTIKFFCFQNFSPLNYFESVIENDPITIDVPHFLLDNDQIPIANISLDLNSLSCEPSHPHLISFYSTVAVQFCMSSYGVFSVSFYQIVGSTLPLQHLDARCAFFTHDSNFLLLLVTDYKITIQDIDQAASLTISTSLKNVVSISPLLDTFPLSSFIVLCCTVRYCELRILSIDFNNDQLQPQGRFRTLASGYFHSAFLLHSGSLKTVGNNVNGKLGDSTQNSRSFPDDVPLVQDAVSVSCGSGHTLALRKSGVVVAFAVNSRGQLGDDTTNERWTPRDLSISAIIVEISAGNEHSLARLHNGSVLSWGRSSSGRLGNTDKITFNDHVSTPTLVTNLFNAVAISGGDEHSLFVRADGTVVACGHNGAGRLGNGHTNSEPLIKPCLFINNAIGVAAGGAHSLVLNRDGSLYVFGSSALGQLGLGDTLHHSTPQLLTGYKFVAVAAGLAFSMGLLENGHVLTWGRNNHGQLGIGTLTNTESPVRVSTLYNVYLITVGSSQAFAVERNGTVYGWGNNVNSVLGDGTTTNKLWPTHLTALDGL